jgi:methylamine dehydrogenase accessory protein MauD
MSGWWLASYLVLWSAVAVTLIVLLTVLRQLGLVYQRLRGKALPFNEGPEIGSKLDELSGVDEVTGQPFRFVDLGSELNLMLFVSPHCSLCKDSLSAVPHLARRERTGVFVVSEGEPDGNEQLRRLIDGHAPFVTSLALQRRLAVESIPFGVVTDGKGVVLAKGLVNSRDDLDDLLEHAAARSTGVTSSPTKRG